MISFKKLLLAIRGNEMKLQLRLGYLHFKNNSTIHFINSEDWPGIKSPKSEVKISKRKCSGITMDPPRAHMRIRKDYNGKFRKLNKTILDANELIPNKDMKNVKRSSSNQVFPISDFF